MRRWIPGFVIHERLFYHENQEGCGMSETGAWGRFLRQRVAVASACYLVLVILWVLAGPFWNTYGPDQLSDAQFQPPTVGHWFGTDVHGRDLLARVIHGARISLLVGVVGAGVSLVIGVSWGATAGYLGGRLDGAMMRFVDILYSMPSIIFVIVLITALEQLVRHGLAWMIPASGGGLARLLLLFAGLGAVSWLTMARIVRGQVLSLRSRGFVEASRAMGASQTHIIWYHILPQITGIVIVYLTLTVPSVILSESFLSYLGLGIQPPQASLGSLIADGAGQINPIRIYWWLLVFPGGFLVSTLLALNFFGDGLRDALDPKSGV
jgi:peptide/nickel transport system permease protein/oligopeptide transport system permease protein